MPNFVPVNQKAHQASGFEKYSHYAHAEGDALAPVLISEIGKLIPSMPLAFYKNEQMEHYQLVALQGLTPGNNLFLGPKKQWLGSYIPACYRGYPFRLFAVEGKAEKVLCIDQDSPSFHAQAEADDQCLFNADGQPSEFVIRIRDFLTLLDKDTYQTQQRVDLLAEYGLITPWHIRHDGKSESQEPLQGLHHIKEAALKDLSPEQLKILVLRGALPLAYGQLLSEQRVESLCHLWSYQVHTAKNSPDQVDLDTLFSEQQDDLLRF